MARPREFDPDQALHEAMFVFWTNEYEQTTIRQLSSAMGLGLPSLYAAFGNKQLLFEQAVDLYKRATDWGITRGVDRYPAREGVKLMLERAAAYYCDPSHPPGCMLMNDPRLAAERALARQWLLQYLCSHEDEFPAGTDLEAVTDFYVAVVAGLSARARDGATEAQLRNVAQIAMTAWPRSGA